MMRIPRAFLRRGDRRAGGFRSRAGRSGSSGSPAAFSVPILLTALIVLSSAITTSCGLEFYPYLDPPRDGNSSLGGYSFTFNHDTDNDVDEFFGYEIYYKFYPETPEGDARYDADTAVIGGSQVLGTSSLTARGYRRIHRSGTLFNAMPLIEVADALKNQGFQVELNFNFTPLQNQALALLPADPLYPIPIFREVVNESGIMVAESFRPADIDAVDSDVLAMLADSGMSAAQIVDYFDINPDLLQLSLYALSFGREGISRTIYSEPEHLQVITLTSTP